MAKPQTTPAGYTVLARRYRSRDFDELVGQEPIARTLQNAIRSNRTAHAYLFCGTRGVGKTSMARIFAKALNATDDLSEKDAIGEAILRGEDLDVIEIDGASNRGVQEARDLIAGAGLSPSRSPYKIYIIDEVHMLTREAFNALLKTMEEPPSHVKFILCTTEPQRVPTTIQSRCQRFDFRAIPAARIAEQIKHILHEEGIKADDEVVAQVARMGCGSMRDALSLLDRLLAGGESKLTMELLEQMLGLPDYTLITQLVDAIVASDAKAGLALAAELLARGASVEQLLELLTEHLRAMMVIAACGEECEFLELSEEARQTAARQAADFEPHALVHMIAICDAVSRNARGSAAARALLDAAIVRLCMTQHFADIPALLAGRGGGGGTGGAGGAAPAAIERKPDDGKKKDQPALTAQIAPPRQSLAPAPPPQRDAEQPTSRSSTIAEVKNAPAHEPLTAETLWQRVLDTASNSMADRNNTRHLICDSFDGRTLKLSLDEDGADVVRYLRNNIDKLIDLVRRATGQTVRIELDSSGIEAGASRLPPEAGMDEASRHPLVQKAMELFDATVVAVSESQLQPPSPAQERLRE